MAGFALLLVVSACRFDDVPGLRLPTVPLDTTTPRPLPSPVEWLDSSLAPVRTTAFDDTAFADLEPFGDAVGDARIVMLGEPTGYDGTAMRAKARLVRYLHERKGFDVLVFESNLHAMRRAWSRIVGGADAIEAARGAVVEPWGTSTELEPLFSYVGTRASSARPLRLDGVDAWFTGVPDADTPTELTSDLEAFLVREQSPLPAAPWWPGFRDVVQRVARFESRERTLDSADATRYRDGSELLRAELNRLVNIAEPDSIGFWLTVAASLDAQLRMRDALADSAPAQAEGIRDTAMTDALVWLAQAAHPGRKLIVWTTGANALRSARELFTPQGSADEAQRSRAVFGTLARVALGDVIYSLGFLAGSGTYGPVPPPAASPVRQLVAPAPESWDGLFVATGRPLAFLQLRRAATAGNAWIFEPRVARPVGYQLKLARWPQVFDGFFFTASMEPATPRP